MSAIFHARRHFFSFFSEAIASSIVGRHSYQTSLCTPYFLVKPSTIPALCWAILYGRFDVTPT